jgi:putative peptidoglycan binding protein
MEALILLLLILAARGREGGGGGWEYERHPTSSPPQLPPAHPTNTSTPEAQTPWPQVVPQGLPAFPAGWEYDTPPPKEVQARASALLQTLWNTGQGSKVTEQTAGRWITYRAEITKGGKHGVVAYRLKKVQAVPSKSAPRPQQTSAPRAPQDRAQAPAPAAPQQPAVYIPQAAPASPSTPVVSIPAPGGSIETRVGPVDERPILHQGAGKGALVALKPWVSIVQQKLNVDLSHGGQGEFGPLTFSAVKALQARNGFTGKDLDGVVGPKTWALLDAIQTAAA